MVDREITLILLVWTKLNFPKLLYAYFLQMEDSSHKHPRDCASPMKGRYLLIAIYKYYEELGSLQNWFEEARELLIIHYKSRLRTEFKRREAIKMVVRCAKSLED